MAVVINGNGTVTGVTTLPDGIVTNADLAGSIDQSKLAGSIPLSKLATTGTGSSSNFLRGDGAYAEAGGGATERLGGATFNAAEAIINPTGFDMEYNVATGYDGYKLYIAVFTVSNAQYVQLRTSRDNGSTWLGDGYNSNTHGRHGTSDKHGAENGDSRFDLIKPKTSDNNPLARLHMEITMYKDTYEDSYFNATMIFAGQVGVASGATWGGTATLCSAYTAIDALKLSCSSGNIDGNWTMYGFKS